MHGTPDYDVVIVGAGHNGLVAAAYLGRAGRRVLVCERAAVAGGAAVTEEIIPGYRSSTGSYALSMLRPDIIAELGLVERGLRWRPKDPQMFVPLPDGRSFRVWRDGVRTREELAAIHRPDGDGYLRWSAFWDGAVALLRPLVEDPSPPTPAEVETWLDRQGRSDVWRLAVAGSAADCVGAFFEADEIRGAFAPQGIIGTHASPEHPGTAWIMAFHALGGELNGADGTWASVEGGMGSVTRCLADAAREAGVEIRTSCPVASVLMGAGGAAGVVLDSGAVVTAPVVVSNADPVRTFLGLVPAATLDDLFVDRVRGWRMDGAVIKINLALNALPPLVGAGPGGDEHRATLLISPSLGYLHRAWEEAAAGSVPRRPFMEVFFQTAVDPALAPPGGHTASAFVQYAPAVGGEGAPEDLHAAALGAVLETLSAVAPSLPGAVIGSQVLLPADLESRFGLTGGDIFHGSMLPDQAFGNRFGYRTPVPGLFLCGSGASPGGCVMGAAGRNAARVVLAGDP